MEREETEVMLHKHAAADPSVLLRMCHKLGSEGWWFLLYVLQNPSLLLFASFSMETLLAAAAAANAEH